MSATHSVSDREDGSDVKPREGAEPDLDAGQDYRRHRQC